jgi:hypothetical protein
MNNIEILEEHELRDTFRLQYGTIMIINKYAKISYWVSEKDIKNKTRKISGLKKFYIVTESFDVYSYIDKKDITINVGTYVLDGCVVEPMSNPDDYFVELKFSGGSLVGNMTQHSQFQDKVKEVLGRYKKV